MVTTVLAGEALGEAGVDGGLTLAYGAHTFLCADTIYAHGTDLQRDAYIPKLASGQWVGCMGLTEPDAGSDVAAMTTRAEKKGDRYVLNGTKMFITNGPVADVAVVYAKTGRDLKHAGISAFIVEKGRKGFSAGNNLIKMGVRTSHTSELILEDCEIPETNRIGREGEGFLMAMQTVEWDRSALLAPFVGGMTYVLKKCARYARDRIPVRPSHRPFSGHPAQAGRYQDLHRGGQEPLLPDRLVQGSGAAPQSSGSGRGQALRGRLEPWDRPMTPWSSSAGTGTVMNTGWNGISGTAASPPSAAGLPISRRRSFQSSFRGHLHMNFDLGEKEKEICGKIRELFAGSEAAELSKMETLPPEDLQKTVRRWLGLLEKTGYPTGSARDHDNSVSLTVIQEQLAALSPPLFLYRGGERPHLRAAGGPFRYRGSEEPCSAPSRGRKKYRRRGPLRTPHEH